MVLSGPKENLDIKDPREYKDLKDKLVHQGKKVIHSNMTGSELLGSGEL